MEAVAANIDLARPGTECTHQPAGRHPQPAGPVILLTLLLAALACSLPFLGTAPSAPLTTAGPAVTIHQPAPSAQAAVGDYIIFIARANDPLGVIRLDLWVDDALVLSQTSPDAAGMNPLSLSYPLVATKTGSYALVARAYNSQGEMGASVVHYVTVVEPAASVPAQEYAQYIVQEGDTLENIATRLGVSVDDILRANPGISNGQLVPGQAIIIPMPKQPPVAAALGTNGVQPVNVSGSQPGGQPGGQPGNLPNNLPGILPQFLPGGLPSIQPGQQAQFIPSLFPNQNGVVFNPPNAALNAPGPPLSST